MIKPKYDLYILIACTIIIGIGVTAFLPSIPVISDFADYEFIARGILEQHKYLPVSADKLIYPPLYPIFLTFSFIIFGYSFTPIYLIQFLLLGIIAIGVYKIGQALQLSRMPRLIASLLILVWPYFILYALVPSSEILFTTFLVLATLYSIRSLKDASVHNLSYAGILFGFATLTRPVSLLLPIWLCLFILIFLFYRKEHNKIRIIKKMLFGIAVYTAIILPWIGYISLNQGYFIPVASNLSHVFNKGNKTFEYLKESPQTTADTDESYIQTLVTTKLENIYLFWNPGASGYHADLLSQKVPFSQMLVWGYRSLFIILLTFSLVALWTHRSYRPILYLWCTIFYFWALHTVLFPFPRYTLPIIPFIILLGTLTLTRYTHIYNEKNSSRNSRA